MTTRLQIGDIQIDVVLKEIKNVHLSVHPPSGRVSISAPSHMNLDAIRVFTISKLGWIKQQQKKFKEQERETPREFLERESHYVWGKRYLLTVIENGHAPLVDLKHDRMVLRIRPGTDEDKRQAIIEEWYREQIKLAVPQLLTKWEPLIRVKVERFFVQRMKTKWGSCNPESRSFRLNTDLAKKPPECLEYIVVHEMVHFLAQHHDARFSALMDQYLPKWRHLREELNAAPLAHATWSY